MASPAAAENGAGATRAVLGSGGGGAAQQRSPASRTAARKAIWRVSRDPDNWLAASTGREAFWSAFCTFNLAVIGSSIVPMPYVMSRVGVAMGLLTMLLVAVANDFTTCLVISSAYATGKDSFESLAEWAGGPRWRAFTQAVLISLLWAPNSGGLSLMGDVAQVMVGQVAALRGGSSSGGSSAGSSSSGGGGWTLRDCAASGQSWMVVMTLAVVLPLSCRAHMRSLESVAAAGLLVVLGLAGLLAWGAVSRGLPAVASGALPVWSLQPSDALPEVFALLGWAFYLQPLLLPIIREMPEGRTGRHALTAAVHSVLLGSSLLLYAFTGFFGAAWFGADTRGNILLNQLLPEHPGLGLAVNACMLFYLAAGAAACQFPLRTSIDVLLVGEHVPMTVQRALAINGLTLGVSLGIALLTPGGAEKVFAIVGATGVCVMCYVLPVGIHLTVLARRRQQARVQVAAKEAAHWTAPLQAEFDGDAVVQLGAAPGDGLGVPLLSAAGAGAAAPSSPHSSVSSLTDWNGVPLATSGGVLPVRLAPGLLRPLVETPGRPAWLDCLLRVVLPLAVMALGIGFSLAALSVAMRDLWAP